jgi:hypothetical protein
VRGDAEPADRIRLRNGRFMLLLRAGLGDPHPGDLLQDLRLRAEGGIDGRGGDVGRRGDGGDGGDKEAL